jgi:hypothetical protein
MAVKIIVSVNQSCTAFRTILDFSERHPYDDGVPAVTELEKGKKGPFALASERRAA